MAHTKAKKYLLEQIQYHIDCIFKLKTAIEVLNGAEIPPLNIDPYEVVEPRKNNRADLKYLRIKAGMTQMEASKAIGVNYNICTILERGKDLKRRSTDNESYNNTNIRISQLEALYNERIKQLI